MQQIFVDLLYIIIIYLSDKQHTECRGCSAKQKAY